MYIYIETLGCPKNTVDSESVEALLIKEGHCMTDNPADADVLIVEDNPADLRIIRELLKPTKIFVTAA